MTAKYFTKAQLYQYVEQFRQSIGITAYPVDCLSVARQHCENLIIETLNFQSDTICGILHREKGLTTIALNASRTPQQQNFDCGHELMHYCLHADSGSSFICEMQPDTQDVHKEWQANEGTSELLMPYKLFIPMISYTLPADETEPMLHVPGNGGKVCRFFGVTSGMVQVRVQSLQYEIAQFRQGVSLDNISVKSKRQQREMASQQRLKRF